MNQRHHMNHINHCSDILFQYGTVEPNQPDPHKPSENDGVAPQCSVTGLDWDDDQYGRVPFQGLEKHLSFVDAHVASSYGWVVRVLTQNQRGYVKARYQTRVGKTCIKFYSLSLF